jgi:hypothetical protein
MRRAVGLPHTNATENLHSQVSASALLKWAGCNPLCRLKSADLTKLKAADMLAGVGDGQSDRALGPHTLNLCMDVKQSEIIHHIPQHP